jgi:hypothetical protein
MKRMVRFRKISVPNDPWRLPVVVAIIERHLDDFLRFTGSMLSHRFP